MTQPFREHISLKMPVPTGAAFQNARECLREGKKMNRNLWIQLIATIILIGLFLVSWLVFNNIKTTDWIILALGILNLIFFVIRLKQK